MPLLPLIAIAGLLVGEGLPPGDHSETLTIEETERSYLVHIPPQYDPKKPTPVVLIFHGGGGNAQSMVRFSGMNQQADKSGFIAVYPNGTGRLNKILTFNGGNCCGYAMRNDVDDVEFTRRLLDDLNTKVHVDRRRIFATGMSNGAIMAYRLASELSDRIAAIAPVAGPMGTESCSPSRPVPVIHFHGTQDENAPLGGGKGKGVSGTHFYSVEHSIESWIAANGCERSPAVRKFPDRAGDGTTITRKVYGNGRQQSEVVLVEIHGGGHTWPGRQSRIKFLGKSTMNVSANEVMWKFFQKHPMPE